MITLDGVKIPDYVKVNAVEFSVLPTITNRLLSIRGRKGQFFAGQDVGQRKISVQITLVSQKINGVMALASDFAKWLYHEKPVDLVIADEPHKTYKVVFEGDSDIEETVSIGQGTLTFICTEPFAFGSDYAKRFTPTAEDDVLSVTNTGNTETYPVIDLEVKENITNISVISKDGFVGIGEPADVDSTSGDSRPRILWDELGSLANWSTGISIDGGNITGTMKTDGYRFLPDTWGTHSGWHGSALTKSLSKQLQDFEAEVLFTIKANKVQQVGRVELYLFDNNNNNIGKIGLADASTGITSGSFFGRAGNIGTGTMFTEERNNKLWGVFDGIMRITRIGNVWECHIGQYDKVKKQYHSRFTKRWTDTGNKHLSKLAKVQLHLGAYSTHIAPATISIDDLKVYERLTLTSSQAPIIAKAGDVLTVDCEKALVLKNGEPFYEALQPDSTFIKLKEGVNGLTVAPSKADVVVRYTERWL